MERIGQIIAASSSTDVKDYDLPYQRTPEKSMGADNNTEDKEARPTRHPADNGTGNAVKPRQPDYETAEHLAAIVESSDDAILTKDLNGVITSWNAGAERLYGYTAEEMIGRPVTLLIPDDRQEEEPTILAQLRRGERIQHYETIRRRKDGSHVDISLCVSPLRNAEGTIIGASKIARDITERKQADERQRLLLREMDHRLKNLFALASSIVGLSAREVQTADELASLVQDRLSALARAHALTLPASLDEHAADKSAGLHDLIRIILAPYDSAEDRCTIAGVNIELSGNAVTSFALILHELATNAAKYGALSTPSGRIAIQCAQDEKRFTLIWNEQGGPSVVQPASEGFGSLLGNVAARGHLAGSIEREWRQDGLVIRLTAARSKLHPANRRS